MQPEQIAQEIHRRRILNSASASFAEARVEAELYALYQIEPLIDHFHGPSMRLRLLDEGGRVVTVVHGDSELCRVPADVVLDFDVFVFSDRSQVLGWTPSSSVRYAPATLTSSKGPIKEVRSRFMWPLPPTFNFTHKDPESLVRIWSYEHAGWWTPEGYFYDSDAEARIRQSLGELAG